MKVMFDIGASDGLYSFQYLHKNQNSKIYAFEPNKKNFNKLYNNTKNIPNIKIYPYAISDISGIKPFYEANYTNSSSLLPFTKNTNKWKHPMPTTPELKTIDTYNVKCVRLEDFIKENNIESIDYLKIDTQGHDLNVIKSFGNKIKIVKELVAEVQIVDYELYLNSSKKDNLVNYLENYNFKITKIQNWSHDQEQNIWFTNSDFYTDEDLKSTLFI